MNRQTRTLHILAAAHERMAANANVGKIVLDVRGS